jgi:hypothetical protein
MSIYPVRLSEWFPPNDEYFWSAYTSVKYTRCLACGKKPLYSKAVGHHSIPWGHGDIWCGWKCCKSGKTGKPDKRRERRLRRRMPNLHESAERYFEVMIMRKSK